jgi:hypothetical protein
MSVVKGSFTISGASKVYANFKEAAEITSYSSSVASVSWQLSNAPTGVSISSSGKLTCSNSVAIGIYTFNITASKQYYNDASITVTLTVAAKRNCSN